VEPAYRNARVLYDCGQYEEALKILNCFQHLIENNEQRQLSLYFGKLNAEIILEQYDEAKEDIKIIKNKIDDMKLVDNVQYVTNRAFLLHTSLFVLYNEKSMEAEQELFLDVCSSEGYLGSIQSACPHIMR